ncbi:Glycine-rich protein family [Melia azedarach]|uniref:Glycine-rich protein family n=1 Tax=Melia azedarach TaxID=155640 RepID=A0ACC1Y7F1_MELAZ|nr:Glycine-rich protein family [Melia azedarach]
MKQDMQADNPADTLARALFCFNNRFVYSGCEEKYRLNESGNLNVPLQSTDLFCNGPCLAETRFVLNCVEKVLSDFIFLNKATVRDIRSVLNSGCSYTSQRGDFNVWRYVQGETSLISGQKVLDVNGFYNLAILSVSCFLIL